MKAYRIDRFVYHQRMHVAATDKTSPAAGHQQCTAETGLAQGPNPEALRTGLMLAYTWKRMILYKLCSTGQVRGEPINNSPVKTIRLL